MRVSDFDFELPAELIAQAAAPRGESRLLVVERAGDRLEDARVWDLPRYLRPGDLLVVNDTRVFAARLLGRRDPSGGAVECLLLRCIEGDVWEALVHPGQKLKAGTRMRFEGPEGVLAAEVLDRHFFGRRTVRLEAVSGGPVDALVDALGHVPLPPYIHRADAPEDRERYQTIFAERRGSVAAPTAGLHFTRGMLEALDRRGVERTMITLHVGYGTFKPVRTETVEEHVVDPNRTRSPRQPRPRSTARSTTGVGSSRSGRRRRGPSRMPRSPAADACAGGRDAAVFIYPGFEFKVIGGLMTNFHLPRSSLLMLVSAFVGRERVLAAYAHAVHERYRFYSYGDAMLIA